MKKLTKKRLAELEAIFQLTDKEMQAVVSCANGVWNEIAYDALEGDTRRTYPAAVVHELVIDADRLEDQVWRHYKRADHPGLDRLFPKSRIWDNDIRAYVWHIVGLVFPAGRYGL